MTVYFDLSNRNLLPLLKFALFWTIWTLLVTKFLVMNKCFDLITMPYRIYLWVECEFVIYHTFNHFIIIIIIIDANAMDMQADVCLRLMRTPILDVGWCAIVSITLLERIARSVFHSSTISLGGEPQWKMPMHVNVSVHSAASMWLWV